ncbi:unnamed protein product [Orchesella dallaii]|uniref:Radial spoke head protein 9 homolog n=1 Tax=Orchesella dallaii TaxID=48710 RepID=A0ABP1QU47_9HEXA
MDWKSLNFAMDYLASSGTVFSVEQRLATQSALTLLQQENQFKQLHFIGKILGTENDYWLVCGIGNDFLKDRTYFYSNNPGMDWVMLPQPADDTMELGLACRGHFVGDPTADSETEICPDNADEINDGEDWVTIKEEERLSATVMAIMNECAVVPRGALIKNANGLVYENKTFEGLSKLEASQFHSFYHVRRPENPWDRNIVVRADYNLSLDFLDSIACDSPVGCWSIQTDQLETTATLRSLYWPGFVGFHQLDTPRYGWLYMGTGKKNWDVPFMILPPPERLKISVVEGGEFQYEEFKGEDENEAEGMNGFYTGNADDEQQAEEYDEV